MQQKNIKANLIGILALLLWSFSALLVSLIKEIPVFELTFLTSFLCFLFYLFRWLSSSQSIKDLKKISKSSFIIMLVGIGGYFVLYYSAFKFAPAVQVNLLNYLWPVLILLFAKLIFKTQHLNKVNLAGIFLAFVGASLILAKDSLVNFKPHNLTGYLFAITAAIIWALYSNKTRTLKYSPDTMGIVFLMLTIITLILHLLFESFQMPSQKSFIIIFLLSIVNMGYSAWDFAMKKGSIKLLASLSYFVPVISTFLIIIFHNQTIPSFLWVSTFLILIGGYIANKKAE